MPVYVFLDTNNWIYLANGFNIMSNDNDDLHLKIFDIIEKRVEEGSLVFLVNSIILEEFERNKVHTEDKINKIARKAKAYRDQLKAVKDFVPEKAAEVQLLIDAIQAKSSQKIADQQAHILKVEELLKTKTKVIAVNNDHKLEAAEMAVAKKAPFIGNKKNSMADAVILLSSVAHLQNNEKIKFNFDFLEDDNDFGYFPESYFVSSNSDDFSAPNDKAKIHPDLEHILKRSETKFFHNLNPLIDSLENAFLTKEEEAIIEDAEDWIHCEVCEYEFSNIDFSRPFRLFDPHLVKGGSRDKDQLPLFEDLDVPIEEPFVEVRTAQCDHCGTDFLECPNCDELVVINEYNTKISCPGCDYKFILHAEVDRKGAVYEGEYEIVMEYKCTNCGEDVESVNDDGMCAECVGYEQIAEEN